MKRSVAILGPTPQFVRWTIRCECPLRELTETNLPDQTFRQLRALRELSNGFVEQRVLDGVCLHPSNVDRPDSEVLGFLAEEVVETYGGLELVTNACQSCDSNVDLEDNPNSWCGCYGWVATDPDYVMQNKRSDIATNERLVEMLTDVFVRQSDLFRSRFQELFRVTNPIWYGIWMEAKLTAQHQVLLLPLFEYIADRLNGERGEKEIVRFVNALRIASRSNRVIETELVPAGVSDGVHWRLGAHCPDCKCPSTSSELAECKCVSCGKRGFPQVGRKSRVLGLRPFMNLGAVIGQQKARELWQSQLESSSDDSGEG